MPKKRSSESTSDSDSGPDDVSFQCIGENRCILRQIEQIGVLFYIFHRCSWTSHILYKRVSIFITIFSAPQQRKQKGKKAMLAMAMAFSIWAKTEKCPFVNSKARCWLTFANSTIRMERIYRAKKASHYLANNGEHWSKVPMKLMQLLQNIERITMAQNTDCSLHFFFGYKKNKIWRIIVKLGEFYLLIFSGNGRHCSIYLEKNWERSLLQITTFFRRIWLYVFLTIIIFAHTKDLVRCITFDVI